MQLENVSFIGKDPFQLASGETKEIECKEFREFLPVNQQADRLRGEEERSDSAALHVLLLRELRAGVRAGLR
jgi:hypothetical protein